MSYKTGGLKTAYTYACGYYTAIYTIYCALESVSDTEVYRMFDEYGNEVPINISCIDDTSHGKYNIIDCLYALRNNGIGSHTFSKFASDDVLVEEMTKEDMDKVFG